MDIKYICNFGRQITYHLLNTLLTRSTYNNLWDAHLLYQAIDISWQDGKVVEHRIYSIE